MTDDDDYGERWLPVADYEGLYEVSDRGRVRSCARFVCFSDGRQRTFPGMVMRPQRGTNGYLSVRLTKDRMAMNRGLHVMVCRAFHGPRPHDGAEVRHLNGNRHDNRASNMDWGSRSENARDRLRHGTNPNAKKTRCSLGHLFSGANLSTRPAASGGTHRFCVSCRRSRHLARYWVRKGEPFDIQAYADEQYMKLGVEPDWQRDTAA